MHLCSALLRIKAIAEAPDLPGEVRDGVAKPAMTEEERTLVHNVTSALFNRKTIRHAAGQAIAAVCEVLEIPVPEKRRAGRGPSQAPAAGTSAPRDHVNENERDARRPTKGCQADGNKKSTDGSNRLTDASKFNPPIERIAKDEEEAIIARLGSKLECADYSKSEQSVSEELDPMDITSSEEDEEADWDAGTFDLKMDSEVDVEEQKGQGKKDEVFFEGLAPHDDVSSSSGEENEPQPRKRALKTSLSRNSVAAKLDERVCVRLRVCLGYRGAARPATEESDGPARTAAALGEEIQGPGEAPTNAAAATAATITATTTGRCPGLA